MIDTRTASILQRAPVILAVTAASYGLSLEPRGPRARTAAHAPHRAEAAAKRRRRAEAHR
jgi:hypothetical protein